MSLAELFTNNYEYLNTVAKRITRCKDQRLAPDLLNSTYLSIHEKDFGVPEFKTNEDFVKWFCKVMKNYFQWPGSEFNKIRRLDFEEKERSQLRERDRYLRRKGVEPEGDNLIGEMNGHPGLYNIPDPEAQRDIEINVEQVNDFTRELIEISSSLGKNKTLQYIELVEFKRTLPAHEATLFELYFELELSTRKIAQLYSDEQNIMNYQSVNLMVNAIKSKIKNYKWKQLNS